MSQLIFLKKNYFRDRLRNNAGESLVLVLMIAGLIGALTTYTMSVLQTQTVGAQSLSEKLAAQDFERAFSAAMASGTVCQYVLNNPAVLTFDTTALGSSPQTINLPGPLYSKVTPGPPVVLGPSVAQVGQLVSEYAKNLRVRSVQLVVNSCTGTTCSSEWKVGFDNGLLTRPLKPISFAMDLRVDNSTPTAATVLSCSRAGTGASACWDQPGISLTEDCQPSVDIVPANPAGYSIAGENVIASSGTNLIIGKGKPAGITGSNNIFAGYSSGLSIAGGGENAAFGIEAGKGIAGGGSNAIIGSFAGTGLDGGLANVVIGDHASQMLSGGISTVSLGYYAGPNISGGIANTMVGRNAGQGVSGGLRHIVFGHLAAQNIPGGWSENLVFGNEAAGTSTGGNNIVFGAYAAPRIPSSQNIIIGADAAPATVAGGTNIVIGAAGTLPGPPSTRIINFGNLLMGVNSAPVNMGIAGYPAGYTFQVYGSFAGAGAYWDTSDSRLKTNIEPVMNSLENLAQITGVNFEWRNDIDRRDSFEQKRDMGVLAQEVEKVFPEAVSKDNRGVRSVGYSKLLAPIVNALKTLNLRMRNLDQRIEKLEKENFQMKKYLCETETSTNDDTLFCRSFNESQRIELDARN